MSEHGPAEATAAARRIQELRALYAAATTRKQWTVEERGWSDGSQTIRCGSGDHEAFGHHSEANAALIVAAVNALPDALTLAGFVLAGDTERLREVEAVERELIRACEKFGPFNSPHEGYAIILEELDELWEHVKANTGRGPDACVEAIQVAAMALRYARDLCEGGV